MDITDIKAENVKKILNILRVSSSDTKRDLAMKTELSFSTVSNLCNELKSKGILFEEKLNDYSVGRTPNKLIFQYQRYCSFCVDFQQEDSLNLAVLDFGNRRYYLEHFDITNMQNIYEPLEIIRKTYESLRNSADFKDVIFVGVGVSVPGIFDRTTGLVVNSTSYFLNEKPLAQMISQQLQLPCYVDNESNLCALSVWQSHENVNNIVYLHSSTGLGVGVVCNGHLLRGSSGYAAEVACIPLGDPKTICPFCGGHGCIENDLAQRGMDVLQFPTLTGEERVQLLEDRGTKLGELISLLTNLFDPAFFYVGGPAMAAYEEMEPYVYKVLHLRSASNMKRGLQIFHDVSSLQTIEQGINQTVYEYWNPLEEKN